MEEKIKTIIRITGIIILLISVNYAYAQPKNNQRKKRLPDSTEINKMIEHLTKEVDLNTAQKTRIKTLYISHFKDMKALHKGEKKQMDQMRIKHEKLKKQLENLVENELNEAQKEKYKEFVKQMGMRKANKGKPRN